MLLNDGCTQAEMTSVAEQAAAQQAAVDKEGDTTR